MTGAMTDPRPDRGAAPGSGDRRRVLLAFAPYLLLSILHVAVLVVGLDDVARVSKLLLMPALGLAVVLIARPLRAAAEGLRPRRWRTPALGQDPDLRDRPPRRQLSAATPYDEGRWA